MSSAPSAQLRPTLNGRACAIEIQKASTVWPDSVRPLRSVIVTDSITGISTPRRSNTLRTARRRGLRVQRVEDGLDQQQVDAAVEQPLDLRLVRLAHLRRTLTARKAGSLTSGEIDSVRLSRADGAGDVARVIGRQRIPLVHGRTRHARCRDVEFVRDGLEPVVGLRDRGAVERVGLDDVGAGLEVLLVDALDDVGAGQDEEVAVATQVVAHGSRSAHRGSPPR